MNKQEKNTQNKNKKGIDKGLSMWQNNQAVSERMSLADGQYKP